MSSATRGEVRAEVRDQIGWVTLSRPGKRNALTSEMWATIPKIVSALSAREDVLGIVLTGADGAFAAGADLADVAAATESRDAAEAYCRGVVGALLAVATAPLPTLALVAGTAAGGGAELALACDVRVADSTASFHFPFARLGIVPDRFTLARLTDTVGASRARLLLFKASTVLAADARDIGLVDELCPQGKLMDVATEWAVALQQGSKRSRRDMKLALMGAEAGMEIAGIMAPMVKSLLRGEARAAAARFFAT